MQWLLAKQRRFNFFLTKCNFRAIEIACMYAKYTRVIFYVRRIGLYLYKYRIYGTISIYILKGLAFVY